LVNHHRLGGSDADLLRDYPGLTPADLEAAWQYSAANMDEIDRAIRENEGGEEGVVE
jgi:type III restriction enzyme